MFLEYVHVLTLGFEVVRKSNKNCNKQNIKNCLNYERNRIGRENGPSYLKGWSTRTIESYYIVDITSPFSTSISFPSRTDCLSLLCARPNAQADIKNQSDQIWRLYLRKAKLDANSASIKTGGGTTPGLDLWWSSNIIPIFIEKLVIQLLRSQRCHPEHPLKLIPYGAREVAQW